MPIRDISGAAAVVTGAAGGLGAAFARGLAAQGCRVALVDVDPGVPDVAAALPGARGYVADVADGVAVGAVAARVAEQIGDAQLLVNNAGVTAAGAFEAVSEADVAWLLGVNLWGVWHGCRAFLPHLRRHREAHVVNVASAFALLAPPGKSAYAASKAAVRALTESLRAELRGSGVGVTLLVPGPLATGIVRAGRAVDEAQREAEARLVERRAEPLERVVARTLRAIRRDEARVLVGREAWLLDLGARLTPAMAQEALARVARRMPWL